MKSALWASISEWIWSSAWRLLSFVIDDVRDFVKVGQGLVVGVIGDDERDLAGEFAALVTVEEIDEAVVVLRNQNDHARAMGGLRQAPLHLELFGDGREMFGEVGEVFIGEINVEVFGVELDAH